MTTTYKHTSLIVSTCVLIAGSMLFTSTHVHAQVEKKTDGTEKKSFMASAKNFFAGNKKDDTIVRKTVQNTVSASTAKNIEAAFAKNDYALYVSTATAAGLKPISETDFKAFVTKRTDGDKIHAAVMAKDYTAYLEATKGTNRNILTQSEFDALAISKATKKETGDKLFAAINANNYAAYTEAIKGTNKKVLTQEEFAIYAAKVKENPKIYENKKPQQVIKSVEREKRKEAPVRTQ
ncbi:MAG: hypothetical protein QM526_01575 [Alphaproteobacteria bacterium]|nr:hypothetical protein [Alphaproteobacteria bacterium]